ncbi:MAG: efflux RND transporter periplasmic adaptor subunit [Candidatus Sericytochromatia bacterium]|nr:efflux RND transporter periplasmic adaptor subunit [Candidatus Tanganyikabacteria bacterium]
MPAATPDPLDRGWGRRTRWAAVAIVSLVVLAGCHRGAKSGPGSKTGERRPVAVVAEPARPAHVVKDLEVNGTIAPRSQVQVLPRTAGRIVELAVAEGDRVRKGQVVARLDTPELHWQVQQQKSMLLMAEANLDQARDNLARMRELAEGGVASKQQLAAAHTQVRVTESQVKQNKAAIALGQANLAHATVTAPIDGIVIVKNLEQGAMAGPTTPIVTIAEGGALQARLAFSERDLSLVNLGGAVRLTSVALPGEVFPARIREISEIVDPQTRLITLKADLARNGRLKIGMNVRGLVAGTPRKALTVPTEAVLTDGAEQVVYLARGATARRVRVEIGVRAPDRTEIRTGLAPGDPVIVQGSAFVRDGDPIVGPASVPATPSKSPARGS